MTQIMKSHFKAAFTCQLAEPVLDALIADRHDKVGSGFMRYSIDQIKQIFRQCKSARGIDSFVDVAHNVFSGNIDFAALDGQNIAMQITELQTAHFADTKRHPHRQKARQFNVCAA